MAAGRSRVDGPGRLMLERDAPADAAKDAGVVPEDVARARATAQAFARDADTRIEADRSRTRATKDRDRSYPRPGEGDIRPRRGRRLPAGEAARVPLTRHQARHVTHAKRAAQSRMPATEVRATAQLVGDQTSWSHLNGILSGQTQQGRRPTDRERQQIQRVDRAIRRAEQANDRTHVVYAALRLDSTLTADTLKDLPVGERFTFDQFTAANHHAHTIAERSSADHVLLEIEGSRGMYLGDADGNRADHLLPRGLDVEVAGFTQADIIGPHGATDRRHILQLRVRNQ